MQIAGGWGDLALKNGNTEMIPPLSQAMHRNVSYLYQNILEELESAVPG